MNWDSIVKELGPRLYRFFLMKTSADQATDLVQDTLVRLFEKVEAGALDLEKGNIESFAFGIAFNITREFRRKDAKWQYNELEESDIGAVEEKDRFHILELRKAVQKLNENEQTVIQLLIDKDLSLQEIADILDMPLNTVKSHMLRAKKKLKELLQGDQNA